MKVLISLVIIVIFKAKYKGDRKSHIEAQHEGGWYSCDICDFKATRKDNLKSHKEGQHGGVSYSCDSCDYKATQTNHLKRHVEAQHEEEWHLLQGNSCWINKTINNVHRK